MRCEQHEKSDPVTPFKMTRVQRLRSDAPPMIAGHRIVDAEGYHTLIVHQFLRSRIFDRGLGKVSNLFA